MTDETPTALAAEVAKIDEQKSHRTAVWFLISLGTLVMVLSTLNTWVERQLLDTDSWVNASTALLDDDDIRQQLSASLVKRGFEINPYDWCVANKTINGSQCTIVWHVDDLKISHKESGVVDDIIASLNAEYGKVGKMSVSRGKKHQYLGMTLDFSKEGKFIVDMEDYLKEMISDLPDDMKGLATTPAADHLFKVRDNVPKLDDEKAELFHHVTAQMLFVAQRGRPDLRTAISFLTKRVQTPDEDDYKKLARAIKYIRRTLPLRLTIEAKYLDQNHWFIDGAFAVHEDMRSHTEA